jgi:TPR repeat protein
MNILRINIFSLCVYLMLLSGCGKDKVQQQSAENDNVSSVEKSGPVNLVYTKNETTEMDKWKNRSMDDLMEDAFNGDSAALYVLGQSFFYGGAGFTIDVEQANQFFALSASLGFSPALNEIRAMYMEDSPNVGLTVVYANLAASQRHPELVIGYHKLRKQTIESFRRGFLQEAEKIAAQKNEIILQNKVGLAKASNKKEFLLFKMTVITDEDSNFDSNYWKDVWQKSKVYHANTAN